MAQTLVLRQRNQLWSPCEVRADRLLPVLIAEPRGCPAGAGDSGLAALSPSSEEPGTNFTVVSRLGPDAKASLPPSPPASNEPWR